MNARESLLAEANYGAGDASRPMRKSKSSTNVAGAPPSAAIPTAPSGTNRKRDSMLLPPSTEHRRQSRQLSADEALISPKSQGPPRSRSFIAPAHVSPSMQGVHTSVQIPTSASYTHHQHHPAMVAATQPGIPWQYHQQRLQPGFMPQVPMHAQPVMMPPMQTPHLHRSSSYAPHLSAAFNLQHASAASPQGGHAEKVGLVQLHAHEIPRSATTLLR